MANDIDAVEVGNNVNTLNILQVEQLGVIEECESSCESDDDDNNSPKDKIQSLAKLPTDLNKENNAPVFGSVSVTGSENVHFGNKIFMNCPVTIKQVLPNSPGIDNPAYCKTEADNLGESSPEKEKQTVIKDKKCAIPRNILRPKTVLLSILVITISVIFLTLVSDYLHSKNSSTDTPSEEDNALITGLNLRIVDRTDWLAQPPEGKLDPLTVPAPWVIITHTAAKACYNQADCVLQVRIIQTYHIESRKWFDIGYNFLVGGDGSAYLGRGWDSVGAHTKGYNNISIGIAFIGTFNHVEPPERQLLACQNLIDYGVRLGKIAKDYKLFGHRQLMSTLSPGDKLYSIIKKWPHWSDSFNDTQAVL